MNNNSLLRILFKFIIIWLLQIVVLKQIQFWIGPYHYEVFVYPLFILLLPAGMQINLLLIIAFAAGLIIDGTYNTLGVHTSSSLLLVFWRSNILEWVIPRGMDDNATPSMKRLKFLPFLRYVAVALLLYLVFYYSMVFFAPAFFVDIIVKSLLSFVVSMIFILILSGILNGLD
jgi:hypothetical protein